MRGGEWVPLMVCRSGLCLIDLAEEAEMTDIVIGAMGMGNTGHFMWFRRLR